MRIVLTLVLFSLSCIHYAPISRADIRPPIKPAELEQQIHRYINYVRRKHGLGEMKWDHRLAAIARSHSRDMANHHFFNHVNLQGESPSDRAKRQGWDQRKRLDGSTFAVGVAENIFLAHLYDKIFTTERNGIPVKRQYEWLDSSRLVQTIVHGWMNSPHHRAVILSQRYDREGIGVAISGYEVYVTENLF